MVYVAQTFSNLFNHCRLAGSFTVRLKDNNVTDGETGRLRIARYEWKARSCLMAVFFQMGPFHVSKVNDLEALQPQRNFWERIFCTVTIKIVSLKVLQVTTNILVMRFRICYHNLFSDSHL